ncbi:MAG: asparagine synthase (glutamine-hydrolyzing) [Acidobacteria bacterium]|jgi:asparagine synthase (glutamine-hydrolysing)|nr:MAG: asparagine synthase (glutamine-hydrolyzing) [Acidobacteriota bacterium]GIU82093.1 MAG: asparagine synthetase B [Pyrinomonadaceae bacterium]
MCGIVGFVNANKAPIKRSILEKMNEAIIHRGPDDDGFFIKENVGLAMRRLAIIDLAGGKQPIHSQDKTKWIVFNGEIYNYQELRDFLIKKGFELYTKSDTEVIVNLYQLYGIECLQYLRGMFAFAIWDDLEKSLFLARDRVGKKPLLYSHQQNGNLIFGSEFSALLKHPEVSREIDYEAIDSYFSYLCVPAPQTAFKQIRKLEPGHWLLWKDGKIRTERYWLPDFSKKIKIDREEAIRETIRILREATKLRLIAEVPLGAFLSGGVDSSTVVALMAQESDKPIKTFSIGFEEQDYSELKYARIVARHVGSEHYEFIVKPEALEVLPTLVEHYGEPYADSSAIPTYYVSRETRKFVTVALNGDGGDESFAGYERYVAMKLAEIYHRFPQKIRSLLIEKPFDLLPISETRRSRIRDLKRFLQAASLDKKERYFRWVSSFDRQAKTEIYTEDFAQLISHHDAFYFLEKWFDAAEGLGIVDTFLFIDQMTYLPNDLLVKVDIASMAVSLEARSPFLDYKLIEFAASLPENLKMNGFGTKSLLKAVASRLVPKEAIYRKKMGFGVPIGNWFRKELKGFVQENLLSEKAAKRNIVKPEVVKRYVIEHVEGRKDHTFKLWTLLMLELWFQKFID